MRPKIKLVRIGPESSIHRDVLNYSLPKLAEKHLPLKLQDHPEIKVNLALVLAIFFDYTRN